MPRSKLLPSVALATALLAPPAALAEEGPAIPLPSESLVPGILVSGSLGGDDTVRYSLSGAQGQVLSVDLNGPGMLPDFLIREATKSEVLFLSSQAAAPVADLALPQPGDYEIEVFLNRAFARQGKAFDYDLAVGLNPPDFADGLAGGPDWWQVNEGQVLTMRAGPSERFTPVGVAEGGAVGRNKGCHMNMGTRWCDLRLVGSGLRGWLPGAELSETAAPIAPEMPEGGPKGNGESFDATGTFPCATDPAAPTHACPFGVIRAGAGNAGVWVALGNGAERYFLFEGGKLVDSDAASKPVLKQIEDLMKIEAGRERFEMPAAVVTGG
ncbi:hypothetical protein C8J30_11267 [Rhodobacter viridis]|uniref:SH3 domain-containing protein n=1 Tax=Rhodobacter viridis TaxID=1054202 RepID=A0A318TXK9_9RHOB|nr:hypothetical protein [Rhodobacter viridis]PYF08650.1 hypothetical protein C8J30_11267 [Rhodobacter viridis]